MKIGGEKCGFKSMYHSMKEANGLIGMLNNKQIDQGANMELVVKDGRQCC